ncbi:hypothetical protein I602_2748 [Polaribacter dokdonensis DSW-5]|uniref:Uncharacterized protein n=1 Tax=Polaribacter dokdonensis DSW-5 TaxID=1300348 RepID=A0A0N0CGD6_9FLAO|nr:hypothetical protein I602_2748 [Polaribacter dokdonensis DSW-5]
MLFFIYYNSFLLNFNNKMMKLYLPNFKANCLYAEAKTLK